MMIATAIHQRRQTFYHPESPHGSTSTSINIPRQISTSETLPQSWSSTSAIISLPQSNYNNITTTNNNNNNNFSLGNDSTLFDYQPPNFSSPSQSLMQTEQSNGWLSNGQLTPTSTSRARHHRESSLSSLGSAGPASPYTVNTSNPQVAGDLYNDFHDYQQTSSKPLTPIHTPSQEHFLAPHYSNFYNLQHFPAMSQEGVSNKMGNAELMPTRDFNGHAARPSVSSVASHDAPTVSTPLGYEGEERQRNAYRNGVPKLDRTMTDVYADELYNPSFQITAAPSTTVSSVPAIVSAANDVFAQRLQAANSQHLSASTTQSPMTITSRDRSPFRHGSPLAPSGNSFARQSPNSFKFGTAAHMREQQKAESDARVLREQMERTSPEQNTPTTISPKDVDLVYHENEEDASMPLFPPQQQQRSPAQYRQPTSIKRETTDADEIASQHSYGSMATSRRESSSAYSTASQATPQQSTFNFAPPSVPGSVRTLPQQYPFVPQTRRQPSTMSNVTEDFPASLTSMESSSSEYAEVSENKKPAGTSADSGTYTCTYHGCTLRFESPSKLQRHKREGHRNSASVIASGDEGGMTSAALRNTQNGPHKCERINPSTGKPCNTIFSRPYDLTRHEDTIHNARKMKVRCHLCTEEKTFSRNDALTRHFRVCHPEHIELTKSRRRNGRD